MTTVAMQVNETGILKVISRVLFPETSTRKPLYSWRSANAGDSLARLTPVDPDSFKVERVRQRKKRTLQKRIESSFNICSDHRNTSGKIEHIDDDVKDVLGKIGVLREISINSKKLRHRPRRKSICLQNERTSALESIEEVNAHHGVDENQSRTRPDRQKPWGRDKAKRSTNMNKTSKTFLRQNIRQIARKVEEAKDASSDGFLLSVSKRPRKRRNMNRTPKKKGVLESKHESGEKEINKKNTKGTPKKKITSSESKIKGDEVLEQVKKDQISTKETEGHFSMADSKIVVDGNAFPNGKLGDDDDQHDDCSRFLILEQHKNKNDLVQNNNADNDEECVDKNRTLECTTGARLELSSECVPQQFASRLTKPSQKKCNTLRRSPRFLQVAMHSKDCANTSDSLKRIPKQMGSSMAVENCSVVSAGECAMHSKDSIDTNDSMKRISKQMGSSMVVENCSVVSTGECSSKTNHQRKLEIPSRRSKRIKRPVQYLIPSMDWKQLPRLKIDETKGMKEEVKVPVTNALTQSSSYSKASTRNSKNSNPLFLNNRGHKKEPIRGPMMDTLPCKKSEPDWNSQALELLKRANAQVKPTSSSYWDDIAEKVEDKTAEECQQKWFAMKNGTFESKSEMTRDNTSSKDPKDDDYNSDDDIFNSTPLRGLSDVVTSLTKMSLDPSEKRLHRIERQSNPDRSFENLSSSALTHESLAQDCSFIRSPLPFRPRYKAYVKRMRKGFRETVGQYRSNEEYVPSSENVLVSINGDIDIDGSLSPGGTMKIDITEGSDLDSDCNSDLEL